MTRSARWATIGIVTLSSACGLTPPSQRGGYDAALALWKKSRIAGYDVVVARSCFCANEATGEVKVQVVANQIASRTYVATGQPVGATFTTFFPDVDGLFQVIQDAFDQHAAQVDVDYDPAYGFPTKINIDYVGNAVDDEVTFTTRTFHTAP